MRRLIPIGPVLLLIACCVSALPQTRDTPSSDSAKKDVLRDRSDRRETRSSPRAPVSTPLRESEPKSAAPTDQASKQEKKSAADQAGASSLPISDRIALWAMIAAAVTAFATLTQAFVTYLVARSISNASALSESLQISREIDRIWQDFNTHAITNNDFRDTIRQLESLSEAPSTTQLRHLIFYLLNIIYISWTSEKSRRDKFEHSRTIIHDHLAILYSKKELVLAILKGHRGYNKSFVEDCVQAFAEMDRERAASVARTGSDSPSWHPVEQHVTEVDSAPPTPPKPLIPAPAPEAPKIDPPQPENPDRDVTREEQARPASKAETPSQPSGAMDSVAPVGKDADSGGALATAPVPARIVREDSTVTKETDNKPSILTRLARPDEWQKVQALNLQIFEFELETCEPTSNVAFPFSPQGEQYFKSATQQQDPYAAIVAELDGVVVGYAIIKRIPEAELTHRVGVVQYQLHTLSVDKSHRDRGIGGVLVDAAKAFAKERGANRLKVTAYAPNQRAEHLYKKKGFTELEITYEATL